MSTFRSDDPAAGEVLGHRYTLGRRLREEPWGEVWLARDQILETEVGLKVLRREAPEWAAAQKVFEREAIQALRLRHPQILGVFHLEKTDRALYLVQEAFLGETLLAQLTRHHHFSLLQALQLLEKACQGLALAHHLGMPHQSLSPLNLLLLGEEVRVANFAFPPAHGDQVMHLELKAYDAPEVIHGDPPTAASNVFSLGVLGFRLVAGSLPYPLTFDEPFPYRLENLPADLEEIPLPLQNFLLRCLSTDPEERFADAGVFQAQLHQVREQMRSSRGGISPTWEDERPHRGRQAAAQAGALLGKVRSAGGPWAQKLGQGAQASWRTLKAAPRRFWLGVGLVALIVILLFMGGVKKSHRTAQAPAPAPVAAPAALPGVGSGPPLVETPETAAPRQGAPTAKSPAGQAPPAAATGAGPAEAKAGPPERYTLVAATYASQKQAQALLTRLKARNYHARIVNRTSDAKTLYQVQIGPITGVKAAEDLARTLQEQEKITPRIMKIAKKTTNKTTTKATSKAGKKPVKKPDSTPDRRPTR